MNLGFDRPGGGCTQCEAMRISGVLTHEQGCPNDRTVRGEMQAGKFSTGGFYAHKVKGPWSGHCSVWFNAGGTLTDVEHTTAAGQARSIKRHGPMWNHIQSWAELFRRKANAT